MSCYEVLGLSEECLEGVGERQSFELQRKPMRHVLVALC